VLDPYGTVIANVRDNKAFYGKATILGKEYRWSRRSICSATNAGIGWL
jgi:hypothetical protein